MAKNDIVTWVRERVTTEVIVAFVLGIVLGLVVLGWWLWPVRWTNADPADLKLSHKESYLQLIADSYALTGNTEMARTRLGMLKGPGEDDSDISAILDNLITSQMAAGNTDAATRLQGLATAVALPPSPTPPSKVGAGGWIWAGSLNRSMRLVSVVFFLLLLGVGVVLLLKQLQKRESLRRKRTPFAGQSPSERAEIEREEVTSLPESTLGQFETTYNLGDEEYDVSYSIESSTGEFLGECGISALENTGSGKTEGAAAFEIWLFDKDDVRTETKVLMSEQAFQDTTLRDELALKGELVQAQPGQVITLETANLRLDARITDLEYESNLGTFSRLTTRLELSQK